ncbi:MAG TPA: pyridoxal-dependent decarboxylase [Gemmatimonadaceae bacterium]|nr:pyridoxal-dependent decarboxylase [Gemmatimonadaceae bacterium]
MNAQIESNPEHLVGADFHRALGRISAWIENYLAHVEQFRVLPDVRPGDILRQLPSRPPDEPATFDTILDDFEKVILPGLTHWNHPGFFAYFAITGSPPGIVAEALTAALNVNAMLWKTAPAATELELRVLDWLRQMLGMDSQWFGVINDTASISTLLALAAAREAKPELNIRTRGMSGRADLPRLRVYTSSQAHSSVDKAVMTLGIGQENLVRLPVDREFRLVPATLANAIAADRAAGMLPVAVVATVGTTGTGRVDPVADVAAICRRENLWLHVDASYAGTAAILPELAHILDGIDGADSVVVNPHKWLFTPQDCSALYTRHPEILRRTFALVPDYLRTSEGDEVVNLMDYGVQLGRRFRALKLWMVIRAYGTQRIRALLRHHIDLAGQFAGWLSSTPGWELAAPQRFSLVVFRYAPADFDEDDRNEANRRILEYVNRSGKVFLSHTVLDGRFVIRLAIGNVATTERHVRTAWSLLREAASQL